ncbi:hypothetical protein BDY21DRAFT_364736 [Lineolata rhizophorae]|uniref:Uncharacterized protein n=1 Tax=Lineolata rhizophorae TaxID=578093 RepID=A0A6A6NYC7_9PEZI|nr:hypothetical protein BDY21DRAFT_364736 [Lineolata rhizophorae]
MYLRRRGKAAGSRAAARPRSSTRCANLGTADRAAAAWLLLLVPLLLDLPGGRAPSVLLTFGRGNETRRLSLAKGRRRVRFRLPAHDDGGRGAGGPEASAARQQRKARPGPSLLGRDAGATPRQGATAARVSREAGGNARGSEGGGRPGDRGGARWERAPRPSHPCAGQSLRAKLWRLSARAVHFRASRPTSAQRSRCRPAPPPTLKTGA